MRKRANEGQLTDKSTRTITFVERVTRTISVLFHEKEMITHKRGEGPDGKDGFFFEPRFVESV